DTDRLFQYVEPSRADAGGDDAAVRAFAFFGKPFEQIGGHQPFASGLREWLAALEHGRSREAVGLRANEIGCPLEDRAAVVRRPAGPSGKRPPGGLDGVVTVGGGAVRDLTDDVFCGGVDDGSRAAAAGVAPFAA